MGPSLLADILSPTRPTAYDGEVELTALPDFDRHSILGFDPTDREQLAETMRAAHPFLRSMMEYRCAVREVETKLNVLNDEFSLQDKRNPIEYIKSRVKEPLSLIDKAQRRGLELSVASLEENIFDIAGLRVVCSFVDDVYSLALALGQQDDIEVLQLKDYIKHPKPSGYRSLHLIVQVPVFLSDAKVLKKVEVQFRTIAMDSWASLEHKLRYKKNVADAEKVGAELAKCAEVAADMDRRMCEIRDLIDAS